MTEADLESLRHRAESGEAAAQYSLANCYHQGFLGITPDLAQAIEWYQRAAAQNHVDSMVNLGIIHLTESQSPNPELACRWFEQAAQLGDSGALYYLGRVHLEGRGVPPDPGRALDAFERATAQGSIAATHHLATILDQGELVERDPVRAVELYKKAAAHGDARAQNHLGVHLLDGDGVAADKIQGRRMLRLASDQGHAPAQCNLAALLVNDGNAEASLRWLHAAAEQGEAQAQFELGQAYRIGRGVAVDLGAAIANYHAAAQQGHLDAQFSLALMLADGAGFDRPCPEVAEQWYQRAAMEGHGGAAHNLGTLFATGRGVAQNLELALELFEYAVSLGNDEAMYSTGLAWAQLGRPDRAAMWAHLSIRHEPAGKGQRLLEVVRSQLTPEQAREAEGLARDWVRENKTMAFMTCRQGDAVPTL